MADKEEENCFKGLYDALNQFFWGLYTFQISFSPISTW